MVTMDLMPVPTRETDPKAASTFNNIIVGDITNSLLTDGEIARMWLGYTALGGDDRFGDDLKLSWRADVIEEIPLGIGKTEVFLTKMLRAAGYLIETKPMVETGKKGLYAITTQDRKIDTIGYVSPRRVARTKRRLARLQTKYSEHMARVRGRLEDAQVERGRKEMELRNGGLPGSIPDGQDNEWSSYEEWPLYNDRDS